MFSGFEPNKSYYYDLSDNNKKHYLSDKFVYINNYFINNNIKYIIQDKLNFYLFMKNFTDRVCPIFGYYGTDKKYYNIKNVDLLEDNSKFVLKPNKGTKGMGVSIVSEIDKNLSISDYIVSPLISPNNYSSRIFSKSLNTIRILTGVLNNEVIIISAVHRFGVDGSGIVDNFSAGGISAYIDVDSGKIIKACQIQHKKKKNVTNHPDTNEMIVGTFIPGWNEMIKELQSIHRSIGFLPYLGWDIAMLENGNFTIIEANHMPDLDLMQCHGPLLSNDKNKKIYNLFK